MVGYVIIGLKWGPRGGGQTIANNVVGVLAKMVGYKEGKDNDT